MAGGFHRLSRLALVITVTELNDMARAASNGESRIPKKGYKTPNAIGRRETFVRKGADGLLGILLQGVGDGDYAGGSSIDDDIHRGLPIVGEGRGLRLEAVERDLPVAHQFEIAEEQRAALNPSLDPIPRDGVDRLGLWGGMT